MSKRQTPDALPFVAASDRNREPILARIRPRMPASGVVLEIGSGTGQHAVYMAPRLPAISWLPTEMQDRMPGLRRRLELQGSTNILPPLELEVSAGPWPEGPFAAAYAANIAHIMSWEQVLATVLGVSARIAINAPFFLYGPFKVDGRYTSPGNQAFDHSLRMQNPQSGLRDVEELEKAARLHHLRLDEVLSMPANNLLLVFRRQP